MEIWVSLPSGVQVPFAESVPKVSTGLPGYTGLYPFTRMSEQVGQGLSLPHPHPRQKQCGGDSQMAQSPSDITGRRSASPGALPSCCVLDTDLKHVILWGDSLVPSSGKWAQLQPRGFFCRVMT